VFFCHKKYHDLFMEGTLGLSSKTSS